MNRHFVEVQQFSRSFMAIYVNFRSFSMISGRYFAPKTDILERNFDWHPIGFSKCQKKLKIHILVNYKVYFCSKFLSQADFPLCEFEIVFPFPSRWIFSNFLILEHHQHIAGNPNQVPNSSDHSFFHFCSF